MAGETVRAAIGWQTGEGLSSLGYKTERFFTDMLETLFPEGSTTFKAMLLDDRGVDIVFTLRGHTYLIQVKATAEPALFPITKLLETKAKLQEYRLHQVYPNEHFMLFTNYYLSDTMKFRLRDSGLEVFSFDLEESTRMLQQKLEGLFRQQARL